MSYPHFETDCPLQRFWDAQSQWSQATFGADSERGPIGPLKHLQKEAAEAQEKPTDNMEFVDCLFLTFDASRRAGFTLAQLTEAAFKKLEINKKRHYPKTVDMNAAVEHDRTSGFCGGCEIELSHKNGSLMDTSMIGTTHTCGKEPEPEPCHCICHRVGLFGLLCCPCTSKMLHEFVNGKPGQAEASAGRDPQRTFPEVTGA